MSSRLGREVLNAPLRTLFGPDTPRSPDEEEDESDGPDQQPPAATAPEQPPRLPPGATPVPPSGKAAPAKPLPALQAEAAARQIAPQPPAQKKTYAHWAQGEDGAFYGSDDGKTWFNYETGQKVE